MTYGGVAPFAGTPRRPGSGLRAELLKELLEGVRPTAGEWGAVGEADRVEVLCARLGAAMDVASRPLRASTGVS